VGEGHERPGESRVQQAVPHRRIDWLRIHDIRSLPLAQQPFPRLPKRFCKSRTHLMQKRFCMSRGFG
jgi:hypothetical protein